jgi:hypothetical protein
VVLCWGPGDKRGLVCSKQGPALSTDPHRLWMEEKTDRERVDLERKEFCLLYNRLVQGTVYCISLKKEYAKPFFILHCLF